MVKKLFYKKSIFSVVCIFLLFQILAFTFFSQNASNNSYIWSSVNSFSQDVSYNISNENINDTSNPLNLDCGSCILIEQKTGQILYSYNSHEKLKPASVTKLMSIYLIMEAISQGKINYDTKIPCSSNAESMGGSQIWLNSSEELSVDEMLKAICVVSANDAVTATRRIYWRN